MENHPHPFHFLAAPARRALTQAGITTLQQAAGWTEHELMELHGMGPNALSRLKEALAEAGLSLRGPG